MIIESYAFGRIQIDGQTYTRDVILLAERVWDGWWREEGHSLSIADLEEAFKAGPDLLVVGTGFLGRMQVPTEVSDEVKGRGIDLRVLPTRKAARLYNELASGDRRVVAAFHLAC